ncbi:hypothetical protein HK098_002060 [Nowakowskiella sp. JEL0407]|nr:hypothetical protein HK098_002060 [Nowakowskiella sp. JEL0407]
MVKTRMFRKATRGNEKKKKQIIYLANFEAEDQSTVVITKVEETVKGLEDLPAERNECKKFVGDENLGAGLKGTLEIDEIEIVEQPLKK